MMRISIKAKAAASFGLLASSSLVTLVAAADSNNAVAPTIVDLSVDLETVSSLNSPGAVGIAEWAAANADIRTALVLEHGKIVADYVREDVDPKQPYHVWSTTKSWISLLIGMLIESNKLSLDETLGDIFTDDQVWVNVSDADIRKAVSIESLLTMTSGMIEPETGWGNTTEGGDGGGATLTGSLAYPDLGTKGEFSYLPISNILSYVFLERAGMSPREYAAQNVFEALGIDDSEIGWLRNQDGVEYPYHGLLLTARHMAKFGQLYLQNGKSGPDKQLVSADWVSTSLSKQVEASVEAPGEVASPPAHYGYLFWILEGANWLGNPSVGNFVCALGLGGQDICIHPELDRVSIQQRDIVDLVGGLYIAGAALDPALSFEVVDSPNGDGTNTTDDGDGNDDMTSAAFGLHLFVPFVLVLLVFVLL